MRAFELPAAIDRHGKLTAQLPTNLDATEARIVVLVDDNTAEPKAPADPNSGQLTFEAVSIYTKNYRFDRES